MKAFQSLGKLLLQDFNEIDLALTPSENLFKELEKLIELDSTFAPEEQTDLMRSHLSRVRRIAAVYTQFVAHCDRQKWGIKGCFIDGLMRECRPTCNPIKHHLYS